jgi:hypothetical protein
LNPPPALQLPLQGDTLTVTRPLRRVLFVLTSLALCGALLAACGGGDDTGPSADQTLQQTFGKTAAAIKTGKLNVDFQLDPEGLLALGGPIRLRLDGPFSAPRGGRLPRFDVDFVATLARQRFTGGVLSTGKQAFVTLDDREYKVDSPFVAKLRKGLAPLSNGKAQPGLKALGIDPLRWVTDAETKGNEQIAGVDTIRVGGKVNVARLLEDLDTLLTKAGGAASGTTGSLFSPTLRKQLSDAVDSAKVDIWTGASDKLLRQLAVKITFTFKDGAQAPIEGLEGGTINLRLRLDDVNTTTVHVSAPTGTRPLATVTNGSLSNFLNGVGAGLTSSSSGIAGGAFLKCITRADGKTTELVRCISRLAP